MAAGTNRIEVERELVWRNCRKDPVYFLNNFWNIEIIGGGYEVAGLRWYQEDEVRTYVAATKGEASDHQNRLKARQIGYTTVALGFAFWDAFFHNNHPWLHAQQAEDDAIKTLAKRVKQSYLMLPAWLRERGPALIKDNATELAFDNGSGIEAIHSGSSAARSQAVYGVIMDEGAFVDNADDLFAALDPLCYGIFLLFSTANGMGNFFHEVWLDAQLSDSEWESGFYPWSVVPGRDQAWYDRTKRLFRNREWLFFQEYPTSPEEAFAKSGRTAFDIEALEATGHWCPPTLKYDLSVIQLDNLDDPVNALIDEGEADLEMWVWQKPYREVDERGRTLRLPNFVISCDVAEGLEHGDYSSITVFDANELEEVASIVAHIPVEDLGAYLEWLGYWYYTALIAVERNNQGLVPLNHLTLAGYPRLLRMDSIASQKRGSRTPRYGWHTNKSTKPKMVIEFAKSIRDEILVLHDERFLNESRTFLADGKGGYGADGKNHDDKIMSTLIGYQAVLDVGQYPIIWIPPDQQPLTFGEVFADASVERIKGSSPLYKPIGHDLSPTSSARSVWLMEENVHRVER